MSTDVVPKRRLVMADSHGSYQGILQCLHRCRFNPDTDLLIHLGDVVDGWNETRQSIELLRHVKHLVYLLCNHDEWAIQFYQGEMRDDLSTWLHHGGKATIASYGVGKPMDKDHLEFLMNAKPYYMTEDNKLFVHAGFDPGKGIEQTDRRDLIWNRNFVHRCDKLSKEGETFKIEPFEEIYLGHTPTTHFGSTVPFRMGNVTLMDTGAAFKGALSIMDIDTKQVWQSDPSQLIYPNQEGRNRLSWEEEQRQLEA